MSNFNKIFNSTTITGRANVAKATYASFALFYIIHRLRKRSKPATHCTDCECKNCHDGKTATPDQYDRDASGGACDVETWRRAIDANKPSTTNTGGTVGNENDITVNTVEVADAGNAAKREVHILGPVKVHKQQAKMKSCDADN
uniref:Putative 60S ribosomal protein L33 n=1 Tax=Bactrocera dorsalis TaxID=27457 RepID=A0A034WVY0_BACDO